MFIIKKYSCYQQECEEEIGLCLYITAGKNVSAYTTPEKLPKDLPINIMRRSNDDAIKKQMPVTKKIKTCVSYDNNL